MKLALDSNRYSDFWNAVPEVVEVVDDADEIYLPFIVVGELRAGFLYGSRGRENERALQAFLSEQDVKVLWPDDATSRQYALIYRQLRQQGTLIPTNDIWIAALVVQRGLTLYARDRHFDHLPQLMRI